MKYTQTENNVQSYEYDSITDYTNHILHTKVNQVFYTNDKSKLGSETNSYEFAKTRSFKQALELLNKGWIPESEKLNEKLPLITKHDNSYQSKSVYSVVGSTPSVPRYLQGIPTNMITRVPHIQKQKIVVINKSLGYSAAWSTQEIERESIKALQLIQILEQKGYRVKLNIVLKSQRREKVQCKVCIKKPDERFSLSKMAFPLVHPSMLRRLMFRWIEIIPTLTDMEFHFSYGTPATPEVPEKEYLLPHSIANIKEFIKNTLLL
jgi:hypothetical protein